MKTYSYAITTPHERDTVSRRLKAAEIRYIAVFRRVAMPPRLRHFLLYVIFTLDIYAIVDTPMPPRLRH